MFTCTSQRLVFEEKSEYFSEKIMLNFIVNFVLTLMPFQRELIGLLFFLKNEALRKKSVKLSNPEYTLNYFLNHLIKLLIIKIFKNKYLITDVYPLISPILTIYFSCFRQLALLQDVQIIKKTNLVTVL